MNDDDDREAYKLTVAETTRYDSRGSVRVHCDCSTCAILGKRKPNGPGVRHYICSGDDRRLVLTWLTLEPALEP
jgi:hypothetical protein